MKEIRPSTWVTLIVLALLIFVPAFFVDVDTLQPPSNGVERDNTIKPINPLGKPDPEPQNKPASNKAPEKPEDNNSNEPRPLD